MYMHLEKAPLNFREQIIVIQVIPAWGWSPGVGRVNIKISLARIKVKLLFSCQFILRENGSITTGNYIKWGEI